MASSSDDEEASNSLRYEHLCRDLNMDKETSSEAWSSYQRISTNYTLEVRVPATFVSVRLLFVCGVYVSSTASRFGIAIWCFCLYNF